jgi:hypothetical protein
MNPMDLLRSHLYYVFQQKILMNPKLNHSDPSYKHLFCPNNIGFRLENAGLVSSSCFFSLFFMCQVMIAYALVFF